MIYRKSILGFGTVAAIVLILVATLPTGIATMNAQAQSADRSQQIRDYLIQAIRALDSGDNAEAIQQLQLATDQIGTFTTISEQSTGGESGESGESNNDGGSNESDDNGEESEEGPDEMTTNQEIMIQTMKKTRS